jgi:hypothetical protein
MKELPILFSTPMVQAILEGRKTMTRRTHGLEKVNENPNHWLGKDVNGLFEFEDSKFRDIIIIQCKPYYQVNDKLWVRETFFDTKPYKQAPLFADSNEFIYKADKDAFIGDHKWKPSLFMPKEAARIWLEVTNVRCEKLHFISEEDAIAEGSPMLNSTNYHFVWFKNLWQAINGKDSWESNPWVFVYEFKRIEKPCPNKTK